MLNRLTLFVLVSTIVATAGNDTQREQFKETRGLGSLLSWVPLLDDHTATHSSGALKDVSGKALEEELDRLVETSLPIIRKYEIDINKGMRTEIDRDASTLALSVALADTYPPKTFTDTNAKSKNNGVAVAKASAHAYATEYGSRAKTRTYNLVNGTGVIADVCKMWAKSDPVNIPVGFCIATLNNEPHHYYGACESGKAVTSCPKIKDVYPKGDNEYKLKLTVKTNDVVVDIKRDLKKEEVPIDCILNVKSYVYGKVVLSSLFENQLPTKFEYLLFGADTDTHTHNGGDKYTHAYTKKDSHTHSACLTHTEWEKDISLDVLKCYVKDFKWYVNGKNICDPEVSFCPFGKKETCTGICQKVEDKYCLISKKELHSLIDFKQIRKMYNKNVNKILPICPYNMKSLP